METKAKGMVLLLSMASGVAAWSNEKGKVEAALPASAGAVMKTLQRQEKDGLMRLNQMYIGKLETLKKAFVQQAKIKEAQAVQSEIDALTKEIETLKAASSPEEDEKEKPEGRRIAGTKWEMDHPQLGGQATVEFFRDGTLSFFHKGYRATWSWEEIEPGIVETWGQTGTKGRGWRFEFEGKSRRAVAISSDRKSKSQARLVR